MELLDKKTSQVEFDNIRALILVGMSTNKSELVKFNGYGAIFANGEDANKVYIV